MGENPPNTENGHDNSTSKTEKSRVQSENNITKTDASENTKDNSIFREKCFIARPSLLEQYFDLNNGPTLTLYNFFVAVFILATMATWAHDFNLHNNPFHHFWLIKWNFEQLPQTMALWMLMFISIILTPFYGLKMWAYYGHHWNQSFFITTYICYQFGFFYWSLQALFFMNLKGACSFIITCENTRLAMKAHSFVRENFAKAKKCVEIRTAEKDVKGYNAVEIPIWPSIGKYFYFLFCPSLLYKDSYPRKSTRNWHKVGSHFIGCMASIYLVNICFTQIIIPHYNRLAYPEDIHWYIMVYNIFPSIIPGAVCLFIGIFYGLLHSWLSMFAEMMCFADCHFYSNWWSSRNMAQYYRNWNLVVHDWLYSYIYRDISTLAGSKGYKWASIVAQIMVFFISSIFHEYWFAIGLRMFCPVIFSIYFGFGGVFFLISRFIKKPYIWNIIMWWNLLIGPGMFFTCYATEWYARQRCARVYENDFLDILVPRFLVCQ